MNAVVFGVLNGAMIIVQAGLFARILQGLVVEQLIWINFEQEIFALLLTALLRSGFIYLQQTAGFSIAAIIKQHIRQLLTAQMAALDVEWAAKQHSGHLATIVVEQCEALDKYFSRYLPQQSIAVIVPLMIMLTTFWINWVVGLIFLVTGPLVPLFMALTGLGAAAASRNQFAEMNWMAGYFLDRLQGLNTLKLFGQAEQEVSNIQMIAHRFRKKTMTVLRIAFMSSAVLEFFSAVAVALVAVYVGLGLLGLIHFGPAQSIDLKEAVFVLLLAPEFFQPLRQLAVYYHDRAAALGAADQILQVLETSAAAESHRHRIDSSYCVELHNVSKQFGDRLVLDNVCLKIHQGEKIALSGETGAGKSTLMSLLMGASRPDQGRILLNGKSLHRQVSQQQIAWVGQRASMFYGSIADNIGMFDPHISRSTVEQAAFTAGVMDFVVELPDGLNTMIGEHGHGLSGGQIQRIALARLLAADKPVALLDEPTANLDTESKMIVLDRLISHLEHKTVIIATHDQEVIHRMERHIHLSNGGLE